MHHSTSESWEGGGGARANACCTSNVKHIIIAVKWRAIKTHAITAEREREQGGCG
jgi:hypothetical protein